MSVRVVGLRRYPVKARRLRRYDQVFDFSAATAPQGVVVTGTAGRWRVGDPRLDAELSARFGADVTVRPEGSTPHQDRGAGSLVGTATLAWCAKEWASTLTRGDFGSTS